MFIPSNVIPKVIVCLYSTPPYTSHTSLSTSELINQQFEAQQTDDHRSTLICDCVFSMEVQRKNSSANLDGQEICCAKQAEKRDQRQS